MADCLHDWRNGPGEREMDSAQRQIVAEHLRNVSQRTGSDLTAAADSTIMSVQQADFRKASLIAASLMNDRLMSVRNMQKLEELAAMWPGGGIPVTAFGDMRDELKHNTWHACVNDCCSWEPSASSSWKAGEKCTQCAEKRFKVGATGNLEPRRWFYGFSSMPDIKARCDSGAHHVALDHLRARGALEPAGGMCDACMCGTDAPCACVNLECGHILSHKVMQVLKNKYGLFQCEEFTDFVIECSADGAPVHKKENGTVVTIFASRPLLTLPGERVSHIHAIVPDMSKLNPGSTHEPSRMDPYFGPLLREEKMIAEKHPSTWIHEPHNGGRTTFLRLVKIITCDHVALVHVLGAMQSAAEHGCVDCVARGESLPSRKWMLLSEAKEAKRAGHEKKKPDSQAARRGFLEAAVRLLLHCPPTVDVNSSGAAEEELGDVHPVLQGTHVVSEEVLSVLRRISVGNAGGKLFLQRDDGPGEDELTADLLKATMNAVWDGLLGVAGSGNRGHGGGGGDGHAAAPAGYFEAAARNLVDADHAELLAKQEDAYSIHCTAKRLKVAIETTTEPGRKDALRDSLKELNYSAKRQKEQFGVVGRQPVPSCWQKMVSSGGVFAHTWAHDPAHTCLYNVWKRLIKEVTMADKLPRGCPFEMGALSKEWQDIVAHRVSILRMPKEAGGAVPTLKAGAGGMKMHHMLSLMDYAQYIFLGVPWPEHIRSGYDHLIRGLHLTLLYEHKSGAARDDERHCSLTYARCVELHMSHKLLSWMLHVWVRHICCDQQDALGAAVFRQGFWWEGDICRLLEPVRRHGARTENPWAVMANSLLRQSRTRVQLDRVCADVTGQVMSPMSHTANSSATQSGSTGPRPVAPVQMVSPGHLSCFVVRLGTGEWTLGLSAARLASFLGVLSVSPARLQAALQCVQKLHAEVEREVGVGVDAMWARAGEVAGIGWLSNYKSSRCDDAIHLDRVGTCRMMLILVFEWGAPRRRREFVVVSRFVQQEFPAGVARSLPLPQRLEMARCCEQQISSGNKGAVCKCAQGFAGEFLKECSHSFRATHATIIHPVANITKKMVLLREHDVFCWQCSAAKSKCTCGSGHAQRERDVVWVAMPAPRHHDSHTF